MGEKAKPVRYFRPTDSRIDRDRGLDRHAPRADLPRTEGRCYPRRATGTIPVGSRKCCVIESLRRLAAGCIHNRPRRR
jgi:hypothetical protein